MKKRTKPFLAIYKVVRNFKHNTHGWIMWGRFVTCTPEYAKNHVIRRELVRCSAEKQDSALKTALWIDVIPDLYKPEPESKPKPEPKTKSNGKPNGKLKDKIKKKVEVKK